MTDDAPRPRMTVGLKNWGERGWRGSLAEQITVHDWHTRSRMIDERFIKSEQAARRLAAEWVRTYNAELLA